MQAVAHNPAFAKKVGVPTKVGKEFTKSGGGMATNKAAKMGQMKKAASAAVAKKPTATVKKAGTPSNALKAYAAGARPAGPRPAGGMGMMGGRPAGAGPRPPAPTGGMGARLGAAARSGMPARPGPTAPSPALDAATANMIRNRTGSIAAGAPKTFGGMKKGGDVKKMASGGLAAGHKSADGIASKGKTKAKQISMAGSKGMKYGGKC